MVYLFYVTKVYSLINWFYFIALQLTVLVHLEVLRTEFGSSYFISNHFFSELEMIVPCKKSEMVMLYTYVLGWLRQKNFKFFFIDGVLIIR